MLLAWETRERSMLDCGSGKYDMESPEVMVGVGISSRDPSAPSLTGVSLFSAESHTLRPELFSGEACRCHSHSAHSEIC